MKSILLALVWLVLCFLPLREVEAQELRAEVYVEAPKLTINDKQVIQQMEEAIEEFLNTTKWTDDAFQEVERIGCSFHFTVVKETGTNSFLMKVSIKATRPVYGSDYETQTLAIIENSVPVYFDPFQPLQKTISGYSDNLSSFLSYYAYLILGLDYDSFGEADGQPYYEIARGIINALPPSVARKDPGWANLDQPYTRFVLVENLLHPKFTAFRKGFYLYHRHGLDLMSTNPVEGRQKMIEALKLIQLTEKNMPNSYAVQIFCNTKRREIVDIFMGATLQERQEVYRIMTRLDPTRVRHYQALISR